MCMDPMERTTGTPILLRIWQISESISTTMELGGINAELVTGLPFTGLEHSRMEELSPTPEQNQAVAQRLSPSDLTKFSSAGTSRFQSLPAVLLPLFTAQLSTLGVKQEPLPLSVVSPFPSAQMSTSTLKS